VALGGKDEMGSSEQHLDNPNPLSLPPQLAARWDNLKVKKVNIFL